MHALCAESDCCGLLWLQEVKGDGKSEVKGDSKAAAGDFAALTALLGSLFLLWFVRSVSASLWPHLLVYATPQDNKPSVNLRLSPWVSGEP